MGLGLYRLIIGTPLFLKLAGQFSIVVDKLVRYFGGLWDNS